MLLRQSNDATNFIPGNLFLIAKNISFIEATANSEVSGWDKTISFIVAFNTIGWKAENILFAAVDAILGDPLIASAFNGEQPAETYAYIKDSTIDITGQLSLSADNKAQLIASVGSSAFSDAATDLVFSAKYQGTAVSGGGILASNKVSSRAKAYITFSTTELEQTNTIIADMGIAIFASDEALIDSQAYVLQSAVSTNTISEGLGAVAAGFFPDDYQYTTLSGTQALTAFSPTSSVLSKFFRVKFSDIHIPTLVGKGVNGSIYEYIGEPGVIDLGTENYNDELKWKVVTLTVEDYFPNLGNVTSSDAKAIGFLVVYNEVRSEVLAYIEKANVTSGGDLSLEAVDNATLKSFAEINVNASGGSNMGAGEVKAYNGQLVSNLLQSKANTYINTSIVMTTGTASVTLNAENSSILDATIMSITSSGDTAVGVVLAFNTIGWESENVLFKTVDALLCTDIGSEKPTEVQAYLLNTAVTAAGNLTLSAINKTQLNATISNAASSAASALKNANGKSVGMVLASNMVSSLAKAYITFVTMPPATTNLNTVTGTLDINAVDDASIYANVKLVNTSVTSNNGGLGIISETLNDQLPADYSSTESARLKFGNRVRLADDYGAYFLSQDAINAIAKEIPQEVIDKLTSMIGTEFSTEQALELELTRHLSAYELLAYEDIILENMDYKGGKPGAIYVYMGDDFAITDDPLYSKPVNYTEFLALNDTDRLKFPLDLNTVDYTDLAYWKLSPETDIIPEDINVTDSNAVSVGGLAVRNDLRSLVEAYISKATVESGNTLNIKVDESAVVFAKTDSNVLSSGGSNEGKGDSIAVNGVIVTNLILSKAEAFIKDSIITVKNFGDLNLDAENNSLIKAINLSTITAAGKAVGVTLAFNTVGWLAQNLLFNTVDALIGSPEIAQAMGNESPARTLANILNSKIRVGGDLSIKAVNAAVLHAKVSNEASSTVCSLYDDEQTAAGAILASNMVSSMAKAYIDYKAYNWTSSDGTQLILPGYLVKRNSDGKIYEYVADLSNSTDPLAFLGLNLINLGITDYSDTAIWRLYTPITGIATVVSGGGFDIYASDDATIFSEVDLSVLASTQNDYGISIIVDAAMKVLLDYGYTTRSGSFIIPDYEEDEFYLPIRVRVDEGYQSRTGKTGLPGRLYEYIGPDNTIIDLGAINYKDNPNWVLIPTIDDIVGYDYSTASGSISVATGEKVKAENDYDDELAEPGYIYEFIGTGQTIDLGNENYLDSTRWKQLFSIGEILAPLKFLTNFTGSPSTAVGGMVVRNDVRSNVESYISNQTTVNVGQNLNISAYENAVIIAKDRSEVTSYGSSAFKKGNSIAVNAVISTNLVLSSAKAYISNAYGTTTLNAGGNLNLIAKNNSIIEATVENKTLSNRVSVGVTLAFNTIGWDAQNILFNTIDAILGTLIGTKQPAATIAFIEKTNIAVDGFLSVIAASLAKITAEIKNAAVAISGSFAEDTKAVTVGVVIAMNKISTAIKAFAQEAASIVAKMGNSSDLMNAIAFSAVNSSIVFARVKSSSISVTASAKKSVSVAVGVSIANNEIDDDLATYVNNTGILQTDSGNVSVYAQENANIDSITSATAISIGISASGGAKSFSGGGAIAVNLIKGNANAYISNSDTDSAGTITISAYNNSDILARVDSSAVAIALSASGTTAGGAIGISLARNTIAYDRDYEYESTPWAGPYNDYTSIETLSELLNGKRVYLDTDLDGCKAGEVYEYIGSSILTGPIDLRNQTYSNPALWKKIVNAQYLQTGDKVKLSDSYDNTKGDGGSIYEYKGTAGLVDIGLTDYTNTTLWTKTDGISGNPLQVYAYIQNSDITADGQVTIDAKADSSIVAEVYAAAVAISASSDKSGALSAGGVVTINRIFSDVQAYIDTADSVTISTGDLIIHAEDNSILDVKALSAAVSGNLSGSNGGALAIGISYARNIIHSGAIAYIANVSNLHVNNGKVEINSLRNSMIDAIAAAAAVSLSGTGSNSVAFSAGGAIAENNILGKTNSYILSSTVTTSGDVLINATNLSTIHAMVLSVSGAISFAGSTGVAVSIGVSVARNFIGYGLTGGYTPIEVKAYIQDSNINCGGALSLIAQEPTNELFALSTTFINTLDDAGTQDEDDPDTVGVYEDQIDAANDLTLLGQLKAEFQTKGVTLSNDLVVTIIKEGSEWILRDRYGKGYKITKTGSVLNIENTMLINAEVLSGSVAIAGSGSTAVSLSGAGVYVENKIATIVKSYLDNDLIKDIFADSISIRALDGSTITVTAGAASVAGAVSGSAGVAVSIGLAIARNQINNIVEAYISDADSLKTTAGGVLVEAISNAVIHAISAAASVSIGGGGTAGVAIGGGGAIAQNIILGKTNAYISNSDLEITGGNLSLLAQNTSEIHAIVAVASAAAALGGTAGVGVSIGISVAINRIGWEADYLYTTNSLNQMVQSGDTVKLADDYQTVYEEVQDISDSDGDGSTTDMVFKKVPDVNDTDGDGDKDELIFQPIQLNKGEPGAIYRYIGQPDTLNLGDQDYTNTALWKKATGDPTAVPAEIQAYILNSKILVTGSVSIQADADESIEAVVMAGSVAIGLGGTVGVAVSGAAVYTENKISTLVQAFIADTNSLLGNASTTIRAASLDMDAKDNSTIHAIAGAASVAASVSGIAGVSVSIGLSMAFNEINNEVKAFLYQVDYAESTGGSISIASTETASIEAISAAASVALAGSFVGVAVAGGGAVASNVILGKTNAYIDTSIIKSFSDVILSVTNTSVIKANVISAAASLGVGFVGVAVSLGGSIAINRIGYTASDSMNPIEVKAYITNSSINAGGLLSLTASANPTIQALTAAGSVAISGGFVGVSGSVAAAVAENKMAASIQAYSSNAISPYVIVGSLSFQAQDASIITATTEAVSLAGAFGAVGVSISIGAADAKNTITNNVTASISNSAGVIANIGAIILEAIENANINATSGAASASAAIGAVGVALSGAGANAINVIQSKATAYVVNSNLSATGTNTSLDVRAGDIDVLASNMASITALILTSSGSVGGGGVGVAGSIGVGISRNYIGYDSNGNPLTEADAAQSKAYIMDSSVTAVDDLQVKAISNQTIDASVLSGSVAIAGGAVAVGATAAGASAYNYIGMIVKAYLHGVVNLSADSITILAKDTSSINALAGSASLAFTIGGVSVAISVGAGTAVNVISTVVEAYIEDTNSNVTYSSSQGNKYLSNGTRIYVEKNYAPVDFSVIYASQPESVKYGDNVLLSDDYAVPDYTYVNGVSQSVALEYGDYVKASTDLVYKYIGSGYKSTGLNIDLKDVIFTDSTKWVKVSGQAGRIYKYLGTDGSINIARQDYDNSSIWRIIGGIEGNVYAYLGADASVNLSFQDYQNSSLWRDVSIGDITIEAVESATITAKAMAASAAAAIGGVGIGFSGAGADVKNVILTDTSAHINNSTIHQSGSLNIHANNDAVIHAEVLSASAALGGGVLSGAVSIGSSTAKNYVGYKLDDTSNPLIVKAYITNSNLYIGGNVDITAEMEASITATVGVASASAAAGLIAGAISGAGADVQNKIASNVFAYISHSTGGILKTDGSISILAQDTSTINASAVAASLAAAFGYSGSVAVSVGVTLATNTVYNQVSAFMDQMNVRNYSGGLSINSIENVTITASTTTASVALAISSFGFAFSGGGASVNSTINTTTKAYIINSTLNLAGDLSVSAINTSKADIGSGVITLSAGLISAAVSGSVSAASIIQIVEAYIENSDITAQDILIAAIGNPEAKSQAIGFTVSTGASVGVSKATASVNSNVNAHIDGISVWVTGAEKRITANSLEVNAQLKFDNNSTYAYAQGSSGGILLGVDATVTEVTTTSIVNSSIGDHMIFDIAAETNVAASNFIRQQAISNSAAVGMIAVGVTKASATSNLTTTATLGAFTQLTGGSLGIYATGDAYDYAETTAGAGGVVGAAAARPYVSNISHTTAGTENDSDIDLVTKGGDNTGKLDIVASQLSSGGTKVITTAYGALSGSGADADYNLNSTVTASVGDNTGINAFIVNIGAINRTDIQDHISGSTGGLVSGAGSDSDLSIYLSTLVHIGSNVTINVVGLSSNDSVFSISALNILGAHDNVTFKTAGALSGAGVDSTINVSFDRARVEVGAGSELYSVGAMDISARGQGDLTTDVAAETYGAGTVTVGTARVELHPINQIFIAGNTVENPTLLRAFGDLNLSVGRDCDPNMVVSPDAYKVQAHWDGFAGSAIPISDINAKAFIVQQNTINIASATKLETGRQANLYAERLGSVDLEGKAKAVSWVSTAQDAINSALGGGGEEQFCGDELAEAHGTVEMNGIIETGLTRNQRLTLSFNSTTTEITGVGDLGITFSLSYKDVESQLVQELENAESLLAQYGYTNSTLKTFYESEIARIKAELNDLGLAIYIYKVGGVITETSVYNGETNLVDTVYPTKSVMTITIGPIWAQAGVIDVRADQLIGSGEFIAPSNTEVTITNNTPAFLEISGITIPAVNGGLFFNGVLMESNTQVDDANKVNVDDDNAQGFNGVDPTFIQGTASFTIPVVTSGNVPSITIQNTMNVSEVSTPAGDVYSWPDILVLGPDNGGSGIYNDNGNVVLATMGTGNIRIEGTIRAKNLTVVAGGDVFITGVSTYAVGGEPASVVSVATTGTYGAGSATAAGVVSAFILYPIDKTLKDSFTYAVGNAVKSPYSLYGDRIHIDAEYINVNGIIQSGLDEYVLTIDSLALQEASNLIMRGRSGRIF